MRRRVPRRTAERPASRLRSARRGAIHATENVAEDAVEILDISRPIGEHTAVWPGDVPFSWRATAATSEGSPYESTCFTMSSHLGTHVDAPSHLLPAAAAVGDLDLATLMGPARVVTLPGRGEVGADALPAKSLGVRRVLFRTGGRAFLSPLAAVRLIERGAALVGTDGTSIDPEDAEDLPAHRALLSRGVVLLENLDLERIAEGDYELICLPLRLIGLEASPVRAVLLRR